MASLNLLFVHEVNYQSKVIFEMHEFPELLATRGNQITYLDFPEGYKFWSGSRPKCSLKIAGRTQPQISLRLERPFTLGVPGIDRLLATVSVIPKLISLLRSNQFDAIVLYAVPTYGAQVVWFAKRFGVPVVFRALDVSHKIRKSIFSKPIKAVEAFVYKNAFQISANNPALARYCDMLGHRTRKAIVNLPPLDIRHFKPKGKNAFLQKSLGIRSGDKCVLYMGSFFHFSGLEQVIHDFAQSADLYPKVKLILVGGGAGASALMKLSQRLGLGERVIFTGFVSYQDLPDYLRLADVAINPMHVVTASDFALPHKVLQYLACGVPVVSTKLKGLSETLENCPGVRFVEASDDVWAVSVSLIYEPQSARRIQLMLPIQRAVDEFESMLAAL